MLTLAPSKPSFSNWATCKRALNLKNFLRRRWLMERIPICAKSWSRNKIQWIMRTKRTRVQLSKLVKTGSSFKNRWLGGTALMMTCWMMSFPDKHTRIRIWTLSSSKEIRWFLMIIWKWVKESMTTQLPICQNQTQTTEIQSLISMNLSQNLCTNNLMRCMWMKSKSKQPISKSKVPQVLMSGEIQIVHKKLKIPTRTSYWSNKELSTKLMICWERISLLTKTQASLDLRGKCLQKWSSQKEVKMIRYLHYWRNFRLQCKWISNNSS